MTKRKTCIFTGAGFSKAIFDQKIQGYFIKDFLSSDASQEFIEYFPDDLKIMMMKVGDIELVMSHYFNLAWSKDDFLEAKGRDLGNSKRAIVYLRAGMAVYFREKFRSSIDKYNNFYRNKFLAFFERRKLTADNIFIVTTNYDLGFEKVIDDLFGNNSYCYPGLSSESGISNGKIPIFKLHGSINWMERRGKSSADKFVGENPKHRRKDIHLDMLDDVTVIPMGDPKFILEFNGDKYLPAISPFLFQKNEWEEQWDFFQEMRKQAHEHMIQADEFYFFGYGLPLADHRMFSWLYPILEKTSGNCTIVDIQESSNLIKMAEVAFKDKAGRLQINSCGLIEYLCLHTHGKQPLQS